MPRIEANAWPRTYPSITAWLWRGANRQDDAALTALAVAWTGLPFAVWLAGFGMIAGAIIGLIGGASSGIAQTLHVNEGVGVLAAIVGALVGALGGFLVIIGSYLRHPEQFLGAILSGFVVGGLTLALLVWLEPELMPLRGYRRLSRREKERLHPLLQEAGRRMELTVVPELWMSDMTKPAAWTHMRAIVVTKGLVGDYDATEAGPKPQLDDSALSAILAHELHHWRVGDVVALRAVWSFYWPVVMFFNLGFWLQSRSGRLGTVGFMLFWPAWVTTKFIVVPLISKRSQLHEYTADWHAAILGDDYRLGLRRALNELSIWEQPRTGWEDAIAATHPPTELRLEELEAPRNLVPAPEPVSVPVLGDGGSPGVQSAPVPRPVRPRVDATAAPVQGASVVPPATPRPVAEPPAATAPPPGPNPAPKSRRKRALRKSDPAEEQPTTTPAPETAPPKSRPARNQPAGPESESDDRTASDATDRWLPTSKPGRNRRGRRRSPSPPDADDADRTS